MQILDYFFLKLMNFQLLTGDGRSGTILLVAPLAAVGFKQEQEPAQVHLHNTAERSAKEMPDTLKAVTENRVVSNQLISSSRSCPFLAHFLVL